MVVVVVGGGGGGGDRGLRLYFSGFLGSISGAEVVKLCTTCLSNPAVTKRVWILLLKQGTTPHTHTLPPTPPTPGPICRDIPASACVKHARLPFKPHPRLRTRHSSSPSRVSWGEGGKMSEFESGLEPASAQSQDQY